ncbi:MAG: carboxypeptidase regulatory-like domain-containing protein [Vicinamibacterales bacterium]
MKPLTVGVFVLLLSLLVSAQGPLPAAPQPPDPLPVRRVVLYKSGVGYFEHIGKVRGNQTVTIDFSSSQLDDVLKSLTSLDLDGGRVSGVSYNSETALDRRLGGLRLPLTEHTTRAEFLTALRGARLEVRSGTTRTIGRLLSVERVERHSNGSTTSVDTVSIVTDGGEMQTIALDAGVSVRIVERALNDEVGKYLGLVASVRDRDLRRLSIATVGSGERDLFVSYVSEVPVWKATYRLVLPGAGETRRPLLQGWAIVDNTVGEDWENVELSLVAGAPQSFVQAISKPYYVQRPVVPLPERMLLSPQTHQGALAAAGPGAVTGTVRDGSGGVLPGATVRLTRAGIRAGEVITDQNGRYRISDVTPGTYDVAVTMAGFRTLNFSNVGVSGGMESVLNATMEIGAISESVTVGASSPELRAAGGAGAAGNVAGRGRGGFGLAGAPAGGVAGPPPPYAPPLPEAISGARLAQQVDAAAAQLGDLFEYKLKEPVTIRKNQSALVPILSQDVQAEKVSLWNAGSGSTRPLRAVWLTNATGLTLDGGSFSIIEGQAFAGEGLVEPLRAGERRLLSYARDLGLLVDSKAEPVPQGVTRIQVARGLLIQELEERQHRTYTVRNEDSEPRTLVIEHPARAGWSLGGTIKPVETTPAWHRFRLTLEPRTTATFTVEESRPTQTQIAISSVTDDQVAVLMRTQALTGPLEAALRQVLARKADVARLNGEVARRQSEVDQIGRDQERVRENMRSLKGSAEERQLVQRYVKQLDDQETRIETLRRQIEALTTERTKAQTDLVSFIERMST